MKQVFLIKTSLFNEAGELEKVDVAVYASEALRDIHYLQMTKELALLPAANGYPDKVETLEDADNFNAEAFGDLPYRYERANTDFVEQNLSQEFTAVAFFKTFKPFYMCYSFDTKEEAEKALLTAMRNVFEKRFAEVADEDELETQENYDDARTRVAYALNAELNECGIRHYVNDNEVSFEEWDFCKFI